VSRLDLIAEPNGAGKTTLYERAIAPDRPGLPFVNPDRIAVTASLGMNSNRPMRQAGPPRRRGMH
jgi:predicted ABC-type ATPase